MKTAITKKLLMFILLASGMFSFSSAAAQCVCYCSSDNQPRYNAECYTKANGNTGCTAGQININNADNITIKNSWASNIQCQNNGR